MIKIKLPKKNNKVEIKDPVDIISSGLSFQSREGFSFHIPVHIKNNKEKYEYKIGFLDELFSITYPDLLRKQIREKILKDYQIFISDRTYREHVQAYHLKKYITFIKK